MSLDVSPHLYLMSSCPLVLFCTCPVSTEGSRLYSTAHSSGLTRFSPQVQHRYIKHSRVHLLTRGSKPNSESLEQGKELRDSHTGKGQGWSSGMAGSRGFNYYCRVSVSDHRSTLLSFMLASFRGRLFPHGEFLQTQMFILLRSSPEQRRLISPKGSNQNPGGMSW